MTGTPLSSDEVRAAAQVHRELGSEYSDAVVESFLEKLDQEIGARIEGRIAELPRERSRQLDPARLARRRSLLAGAAIGAVGAGTPLTVFAFSMADGLGKSQWLAVIWIFIAVVFVAAMAGAGAIRTPQFRNSTQRTER
jgi:VIT1/CCC1 family predicted Fe2+/Mn2+ transporter